MARTTLMDRQTAEQALRDFLFARQVDTDALGSESAPVPFPRRPDVLASR